VDRKERTGKIAAALTVTGAVRFSRAAVHLTTGDTMYAHRIHTIDSAPQKPRSALRGLMQRLGLAFLACTLVIGATSAASAFEPAAERSHSRARRTPLLTLSFRRTPNSEPPYSPKTQPS
jgi:hypothetical protein